MRLLDRDLEEDRLRGAIADVRGGGQRALGIVGDAGIGKSALLDLARAAASDAGLLVLGGRAADHERDVPFALVVDALDDHVAGLHPVRRATLPVEVGAILPSAAVDGAASPAPGAGPAERFRSHRALRALLELLGRERPLLLVLDDVHWADDASVELVLHLLRRPPRAGFGLLVALRPSPVSARLLDAGRRAAGWEELRLAPLGAAAALSLLPAELDERRRRRILADAGGNPLFLGELARRAAAGAADGPLPDTIAAAVAQEVGALGGDARGFLAAAAVAGDPFDLDVAAAAAGADPLAAAAALDALVAAGLVAPGQTGRSFRFRHPLVHRAVLDGVPPGRRLEAHGRAAALLAARGAAPAQRAYHVARCAAPGDEAAIALLITAAEEAHDDAPAAAAHWYEAALRLVPHDDARRRADLLAPLGAALAAAGRTEEGRAAVERCIALLGPEDVRRRVELRTERAIADVLLGRFADADAAVALALEEAPPDLRPGIMIHKGATEAFGGDAGAVARWAERAAEELAALRAAGAPEDPIAEAIVTGTLGLGRLMGGRGGADLVEQARRRLETVDDAALAARLDAVWSVGGNLSQLERYADAAPVLRRGVRLGREHRRGHYARHLQTLLAMAELPLLELEAAHEHALAAEEGARLQGLSFETAFALSLRARVLAVQGDAAEAERAGSECEELLEGLPRAGSVGATLGQVAVARLGHDPERLLAALVAACGERFERVSPPAAGALLGPAAAAAVALGRHDEAERFVGALEALTRGQALPATAVRAARARAELLLARGGAAVADAAGAARAAVEAADRERLPLEAAVSGLVAGRALAAAGDRDGAVAALQRVAEDAARAGAGALRDAAARELRRAGARVSMTAQRAADAGSGRAGLTERELAVASLAARGQTNKQVAATLYLSEKTVERHLSRVYAKLGVQGRAELARSFAE